MKNQVQKKEWKAPTWWTCGLVQKMIWEASKGTGAARVATMQFFHLTGGSSPPTRAALLSILGIPVYSCCIPLLQHSGVSRFEPQVLIASILITHKIRYQKFKVSLLSKILISCNRTSFTLDIWLKASVYSFCLFVCFWKIYHNFHLGINTYVPTVLWIHFWLQTCVNNQIVKCFYDEPITKSLRTSLI